MCALPIGKLPPELLKTLLGYIPGDSSVIVGPGIGRDAAAIRVGDQILVLKTDPITFPTDDAGWYLVNINANDIACMGAEPAWLLVTALLPERSTTRELVESIFNSLKTACSDLGCLLIGGHTEITEGLDRPILVGQMIGTASDQSLIDPSTARAGDVVMLIGGIAIEGTSILAAEAADQLANVVDPQLLTRAAAFAREPGISIVPYARRLVADQEIPVKAMHDPTEGGLATGLREIAESTGLGIEIDAGAVHVYPETRAICSALNLDPWGLIASGALLAVVSENATSRVISTFQDMNVPVARIGGLTADPEERAMIVDGERDELPEFAVDEIARYFTEL